MRPGNFGTGSPAFRGIASPSFGGAGATLVLILALLGACGGDTPTPAAPRPDAEAGHESTAGPDAAAGHESTADAGAGHESTAGPDAAPHSDTHTGVQHGSPEPPETAVATVAKRTAGALSGSDWGLVYDLSCPALVGDQSRESYVAALSAAGSPAQLAGGTLSVGSPTTAEGINASGLPVAAGEVRWMQMLHGEEIIGVARFVDAGDGFRYCGLSL